MKKDTLRPSSAMKKDTLRPASAKVKRPGSVSNDDQTKSEHISNSGLRDLNGGQGDQHRAQNTTANCEERGEGDKFMRQERELLTACTDSAQATDPSPEAQSVSSACPRPVSARQKQKQPQGHQQELSALPAVSAHAPATRPPLPPSRLTGYKRNKMTPHLEQEWAAIRKEYGAQPGAKMFVLDGSFAGVRDALLDRGWVEHHEKDSLCFDLKWTIKTGDIDFQALQPSQIVNHFKKNRAFTTKVGLSHSLRSLKWFLEVDAGRLLPR